MQSKPSNQYPRSTIEKLIAAIPFFKEIKKADEWQFEMLLQYSQLIFCQPDEVVFKQGSRDFCLYFLLKGQLLVTVGDQDQMVNYITPGEVFGDLSMLLQLPRTATVVADGNSREIIIFAIDFTIFGELLDFQNIKLATKLIYYRNLVHSLRWKLEVYRSQYPGHKLANSHRSVQLFRGIRGTSDELLSLDQQARQMGELLICWNQQFGHLSVINASPLNGQIIDELSA